MRKRNLELLLWSTIQKNKKNHNVNNSSNREVAKKKGKSNLQMMFISLKTSVAKDLITKSNNLNEQRIKRNYRVIRFTNLKIKEVSVHRPPVSKTIIKIQMIITNVVEGTIGVAVVEANNKEGAETNEVAIEMISLGRL
jgi:hypothetical protein